MGLFKQKVKNFLEGTYFDKVSYEQFKSDWLNTFLDYDESDDAEIREIYDEIEIPKRSTSGSAGYDFVSPIHLCFKPGESIMIPTGIKCNMERGMVLMMFPRSGLGTKYRLIPCNLTGIVDSDYINAENEGHIFMKMVNDGDERVVLKQGQAFCQGILTNYHVTDYDIASGSRTGGMGSTDKKQ